jgi:hypothetical protein
MANEESIGSHRVLVDGDTVLTRYVGVPELVHLREIHQHFDRVLVEHGRLFIINDMSHSGVPPTEARRWIADWARTRRVSGIANFGASLPIRMLQSLVLNAARLVGSHPMGNIVNTAGEAEAFAWVAAQRRLLG